MGLGSLESMGSTTENVSTLSSHPSSLVDRRLPSSQGQFGHLRFENVVNHELVTIDVERKVGLHLPKLWQKKRLP
jgi:hypothetical protein